MSISSISSFFSERNHTYTQQSIRSYCSDSYVTADITHTEVLILHTYSITHACRMQSFSSNRYDILPWKGCLRVCVATNTLSYLYTLYRYHRLSVFCILLCIRALIFFLDFSLSNIPLPVRRFICRLLLPLTSNLTKYFYDHELYLKVCDTLASTPCVDIAYDIDSSLPYSRNWSSYKLRPPVSLYTLVLSLYPTCILLNYTSHLSSFLYFLNNLLTRILPLDALASTCSAVYFLRYLPDYIHVNSY